MFNREDLRELAGYRVDAPVLSVYLNVDPTNRSRDEYRLELRQLLKQADGVAAREDVEAVETFFDHEYDWSGRGAVVFSCQSDDFWRTYSLAIPVSSGVTVAHRPYISPLAELVDAYGRYAVAVVDRRQLRSFFFNLGELRAAEEFVGEDVRKLKRGRGSSGGHGRRGGAPISSQHEVEVVRRNIREAVDELERFCQRYEPERLIIAGGDRTVAQFKDALPKHLQDKVIGSFSADMNATEPEIRERSLEILRDVEEERKESLVQAVFTAAAKGENGVIRLADTLGAAHEGRIQTLVIDRDYHEPGYQCKNCAYITDHALEKCPFCGGDFMEIPDAAEALVTKVIEEGGEVEVVEDHPKAEQFGVGALLRY
jgi:peptide subunit release factor 1 (eRF1)